MYEAILEELGRRELVKEAEQNAWRDTVLGGGAAAAGAGLGGYAGMRVGAKGAVPHVEKAQRKVKAMQAARKRSGGFLGKNFRTYRKVQQRHAGKMQQEARAELGAAARKVLKGGGRGLAAGAILGGLGGIAASRMVGKEKNSSDEIEEALVFAAFRDELEKLSMRQINVRKTVKNIEHILGGGKKSAPARTLAGAIPRSPVMPAKGRSRWARGSKSHLHPVGLESARKLAPGSN